MKKPLKKQSNRKLLDDLLKTDAGRESLKAALDPFVVDFKTVGDIVEKVRSSQNPWGWMMLADFFEQERRKLAELLESATMSVKQTRTVEIIDPDKPAWMREGDND